MDVKSPSGLLGRHSTASSHSVGQIWENVRIKSLPVFSTSDGFLTEALQAEAFGGPWKVAGGLEPIGQLPQFGVLFAHNFPAMIVSHFWQLHDMNAGSEKEILRWELRE